MISVRCLPAGDGAVLAELGSLDETLALFQALDAWPAGVEDVIPAARTLLVPFDPSVLAARGVARGRAMPILPRCRPSPRKKMVFGPTRSRSGGGAPK